MRRNNQENSLNLDIHFHPVTQYCTRPPRGVEAAWRLSGRSRAHLRVPLPGWRSISRRSQFSTHSVPCLLSFSIPKHHPLAFCSFWTFRVLLGCSPTVRFIEAAARHRRDLRPPLALPLSAALARRARRKATRNHGSVIPTFGQVHIAKPPRTSWVPLSFVTHCNGVVTRILPCSRVLCFSFPHSCPNIRDIPRPAEN